MPALFFRYELSPIKVRYTYNYTSWFDFAIVVFSLFGGFFTCAGMIEALVRNAIGVVAPDASAKTGSD